MTLRLRKPFAFAALGVLALAAFTLLAEDSDPVPFTDVRRQTEEFIELQRTIQLTAEQEEVKREALEALPAPCCSNNTAYTCCCPCNMSLSVWGLSHLLIAKHGYDAEQVRAKVKAWIELINPDGYSGDVCYTGGCGRPFEHNGCGGMNRSHVSWAD